VEDGKAVDFDLDVAARLGFPKPKYMAVERERRWLCARVPRDLIVQSHAVVDVYVTGTQLRLREARLLGGGKPMLRLTRKVDVDAHTRLLTSIYLAEHEFALLAAVLRGSRIRKLRHTLVPRGGVAMSVDEFQDELNGLILAEAEFDTSEAMRALSPPDFVAREVTDDARFSGGALASNGLPPDR
jgi:CYTH domain-containing protein